MATETGENKYKKYGQPTLDLVFTGEKKSLTDRVGNKTVEFTRSSTATYVEGGVVKYASQDQARFEKEGLLIEESRTNLIPNSTDLTGWSTITLGDGVTPTSANVTDTAPDNSTSVTKVTLSRTTATTSNYSIYRVSVTHASAVATGSIYVKAFSASDVGKVVDVYNNQGSPQDFQTVTLTDEWQRMTSVGASPSTQSFLSVALFNSSASTGTVNVLIWGAQVEVGSFPTSYIPTAGSTVTRAQELVEITGDNFSSWWNSSEGSIVTVADNFPSNGNRKAWEFNDGTVTASGPTLVGSVTFFQSPVAGNYTNSTINFGSIKTKTAFTFTTSAFIAGSGDGSDTLTNTSGLDPNVVKVVIGKGRGGYSEVLNGTIARIHYYPTQVSNEQLEALTS
jgi:hypothetical protein